MSKNTEKDIISMWKKLEITLHELFPNKEIEVNVEHYRKIDLIFKEKSIKHEFTYITYIEPHHLDMFPSIMNKYTENIIDEIKRKLERYVYR